MKRREITEAEIEMILSEPDLTRDKGGGVVEYVRRLNGQVLMVYLAEESRIVTVFCSSKLHKYL